MAVNITDLPLELLSYLFSLLSGKHLPSVAETCRVFYNALQIESVWHRRCLEEFNISNIDTNLISYKELYTKLLYHCGSVLGLWRARVTYYGGLLNVKLSGNQIIATEYLAPPDPHIDQPLRSRPLFALELDKQGKIVCTCCRGYKNKPHLASISKCVTVEDKSLFRFECKTETYHAHSSLSDEPILLRLNEAVMEWLRDETGNPNLDVADIHEYERALMKFIVILPFECNTEFVRLKLPKSPSYGVPIEPGLFKGSYGQHGIEIIILQYTDDKHAEGIKITGDPNVPTGKVTLRADLNRTMILTKEQQSSMALLQDIDTADLPPDANLETLPDQPFLVPHDCMERVNFTQKRCKYRCHSEGQIAGHGYTNPSFIRGHWIVFDENTFGHIWIDLHSLSIYSRVTEALTG